MNWKKIRLELARTDGFPRGSASRAYLLQLPMDDDGRIDCAGVEQHPSQATIRRFWPSQPDDFGRLVHDGGKWVVRWDGGSSGRVARLGAETLHLGEVVVLDDPQAGALPFRVASIAGLGRGPSE